MAVNPNLPVPVPQGLVKSLAARALPSPMPPQQPPPDQQSPIPQPPAGQPALQGPPPGAPASGDPAPQQLPPAVLDALTTIMKDPQAREQIQQIIDQLGGEAAQKNPLDVIDPQTKLALAQSWNSRKKAMALELTAQRGVNPGASRADDEALLTIWFTTPLDPNAPPDDPRCLSLDDIEDYADAVRLDLISKGMSDPDKVEDQVMRECFPLRESLIRTGRPFVKDQVEFAAEMVKLAARWCEDGTPLPQPDMSVLKATQAGKGDPESQPRETDSEAFPQGEGYGMAAMRAG